MREYFMPMALALFLSTLSLGCTVAVPQLASGRMVWQDDHSRIEVAFNDADRQRIHDYYVQQDKGRHHHHHKKHHLPPGQQKHLARHGKLPPGLAKRALPDDLERGLSRLPRNYVRVRIGSDIVLLNQQTQVVMDVIYGGGGALIVGEDD